MQFDLRRYLDDLSKGDPFIVGVTVVFGVMTLLVLAVWVIDRMRRRKKKRKPGAGKGSRRRPGTGAD
jgi:hypothetical protein